MTLNDTFILMNSGNVDGLSHVKLASILIFDELQPNNSNYEYKDYTCVDSCVDASALHEALVEKFGMVSTIPLLFRQL